MLLGKACDAFEAGQLMLAACRFDRDDTDRRILFLEKPADTAQGAARADAREEIVDLAPRLLPDLGTRGAIVRLDVQFALVLIGAHVPAAVSLAFDHALDDTTGAFGREQRTQLVFDLDQLSA